MSATAFIARVEACDKGTEKHTGSNNRAPLSLTPFLKEENAADRKEMKRSSKEVDADFCLS